MSDSIGEGQLSYSISTMTKAKPYFMNLTKDLSWLNSRNFEHTTRDGHVKGYLVDLDIVCKEAVPFTLTSAPNSWKMRNSFRKFHFARDKMFKDSGVSKREMGRYGRTIRPFLDPEMITVTYDPPFPPVYGENDVLIPIGCTDNKREWTYTTLASSPGYQEDEYPPNINDTGLTDVWALTVCGVKKDQDVSAGGTETWQHVGMIEAYNLDRQEVATPLGDQAIDGQNNPLAALTSGTIVSGEVTDIAEEQELENPPYDQRDDGDSINRILCDYGNTNTDTLQVIRLRNIFVPAGILTVSQGTSGNLVQDVVLFATVKAIVNCKDWA